MTDNLSICDVILLKMLILGQPQLLLINTSLVVEIETIKDFIHHKSKQVPSKVHRNDFGPHSFTHNFISDLIIFELDEMMIDNVLTTQETT